MLGDGCRKNKLGLGFRGRRPFSPNGVNLLPLTKSARCDVAYALSMRAALRFQTSRPRPIHTHPLTAAAVAHMCYTSLHTSPCYCCAALQALPSFMRTPSMGKRLQHHPSMTAQIMRHPFMVGAMLAVGNQGASMRRMASVNTASVVARLQQQQPGGEQAPTHPPTPLTRMHAAP